MPFQARLYRRLERRTCRFVKRRRSQGIVYPAGYCSVDRNRCVTHHRGLYRMWVRTALGRKKQAIAEPPAAVYDAQDIEDDMLYEEQGPGDYEQDGFVVSDSSVEYLDSDTGIDKTNILSGKRPTSTEALCESDQDSGDSEWEP